MIESKEVREKYDQAISSLDKDLGGITVSNISPSFLDRVLVEVYGDKVRLNSVSSITVFSGQTLSVQPYDKSTLKSIEKGINLANLGVSVSVEDNCARVTLPMITQERRAELSKIVAGLGEKAKVALRNIRRDIMTDLKAMEKQGESEDTIKKKSSEVDKITEEYTKKIDEKITNKNKAVMNV